jgi:hypothetical protein
VTVGTRAWDGLLEALRANLIDALFLKGTFSNAVWLAQPLQAVHYQRDAVSQLNGSCLLARKQNGANDWW